MKPKKNLSALTIRRLRKVAAAILKEPELYDQGEPFLPDPTCGTQACIAGWAVHLFDKRFDRNGSLPDAAARALQIDRSEVGKLYWRSSWPEKLCDQLTGGSALKKARVAARRIEHFIKTDGAE